MIDIRDVVFYYSKWCQDEEIISVLIEEIMLFDFCGNNVKFYF